MQRKTLNGNQCYCTGCHDYFNSVSSFDRHRAGDWMNRGANRRCRTAEELTAKGWSRNKRGFWIESRYMPERLDVVTHTGGNGLDPSSPTGGVS